MMKRVGVFLIGALILAGAGRAEVDPAQIQFTRQASRRLVFDRPQEIGLWSLEPASIVGLELMHPVTPGDGSQPAAYTVEKDVLQIKAEKACRSALWLGGMNPFAGHVLTVESLTGSGSAGFVFTSGDGSDGVSIVLEFKDQRAASVVFAVQRDGKEKYRRTVHRFDSDPPRAPFEFRVQMLGSGLTVFLQKDRLPQPVGQVDNFNEHLDLRRKEAIASYETRLITDLQPRSAVTVRQARAVIDTGVGLADMRAITYQDGRPYLDRGRVWLTMSIRGRKLPQHLQGVFSMDPSVFDLKLEGLVLFDRGDGLLRNEIATHLFYDERAGEWRGVTTGFSAYADAKEEKELWAVRSGKDPRFGISVLAARPLGLVGPYEDAHMLYDEAAGKWRMLLCEDHGGFRAAVRQSDRWDGGYERISGPVKVDSTGTIIQKVGAKRYCLFGSADRRLYVYSYPGLEPVGHLSMNLPPWNENTGGRVWANLVPLPEGYLSRYLLLTMDRLNYPGFRESNWSYGALYLYHGRLPDGDGQPYEYDRR